MMSLWYVYNPTGNHVGPVTTDLLARGIVAGRVPRDSHVGAVGSGSWVPAFDVPEVAQAVRRVESTPPPPPNASSTIVMPSVATPMPVVEPPAPVPPPALAEKAAPAEKPAGVPAPVTASPLLPLGIFGASAFVAVILFITSVFLQR